MIEKRPPARDELYLRWVRQQPSVISGQMGCEAHHPIGQRFSQSKCSDYFALALTSEEHRSLHRGWKEWEGRHGSQWMHAARTLERAVVAGFFSNGAPELAIKQPSRRQKGTALSTSKTLPRRET